jgi:phospholipase C
VDHGVYDHAALVKFVSWRFGLAPLAPRDRWSRNLANAFDFRHPDFSMPNLPVVPDPGPHSCDEAVSVGAIDGEEPFWLALKDYADRSAWRHV